MSWSIAPPARARVGTPPGQRVAPIHPGQRRRSPEIGELRIPGRWRIGGMGAVLGRGLVPRGRGGLLTGATRAVGRAGGDTVQLPGAHADPVASQGRQQGRGRLWQRDCSSSQCPRSVSSGFVLAAGAAGSAPGFGPACELAEVNVRPPRRRKRSVCRVRMRASLIGAGARGAGGRGRGFSSDDSSTNPGAKSGRGHRAPVQPPSGTRLPSEAQGAAGFRGARCSGLRARATSGHVVLSPSSSGPRGLSPLRIRPMGEALAHRLRTEA